MTEAWFMLMIAIVPSNSTNLFAARYAYPTEDACIADAPNRKVQQHGVRFSESGKNLIETGGAVIVCVKGLINKTWVTKKSP